MLEVLIWRICMGRVLASVNAAIPNYGIFPSSYVRKATGNDGLRSCNVDPLLA